MVVCGIVRRGTSTFFVLKYLQGNNPENRGKKLYFNSCVNYFTGRSQQRFQRWSTSRRQILLKFCRNTASLLDCIDLQNYKTKHTVFSGRFVKSNPTNCTGRLIPPRKPKNNARLHDKKGGIRVSINFEKKSFFSCWSYSILLWKT